MFGLCGKDKSDTLLQPYKLKYVHGAKEKNIYVHIYPSANNTTPKYFLKVARQAVTALISVCFAIHRRSGRRITPTP